KEGADPLAFLVGRVEVKYGGDPARTTVVDLSPYIDRKKKVVRSITGEVRLDYGTGLCTGDTPKAQGASGFLGKAGQIDLRDVRIRSGNDYGRVTIVTLDDQPLRASKKILVQTGTSARLTGWKTKPTRFQGDAKQMFQGYEIVATGKPPWQIVDTDVTLVVNNANIKTATLLDTSGYRVKKINGERSRGKFIIKVSPNALYVVLE